VKNTILNGCGDTGPGPCWELQHNSFRCTQTVCTLNLYDFILLKAYSSEMLNIVTSSLVRVDRVDDDSLGDGENHNTIKTIETCQRSVKLLEQLEVSGQMSSHNFYKMSPLTISSTKNAIDVEASEVSSDSTQAFPLSKSSSLQSTSTYIHEVSACHFKPVPLWMCPIPEQIHSKFDKRFTVFATSLCTIKTQRSILCLIRIILWRLGVSCNLVAPAMDHATSLFLRLMNQPSCEHIELGENDEIEDLVLSEFVGEQNIQYVSDDELGFYDGDSTHISKSCQSQHLTDHHPSVDTRNEFNIVEGVDDKESNEFVQLWSKRKLALEKRAEEKAKTTFSQWQRDNKTLQDAIDGSLKEYVELYENAHALRLQFEAEKSKWMSRIIAMTQKSSHGKSIAQCQQYYHHIKYIYRSRTTHISNV
jgi:hypothetical protein